jgi:hypothetical protein
MYICPITASTMVRPRATPVTGRISPRPSEVRTTRLRFGAPRWIERGGHTADGGFLEAERVLLE